MSTPCKMNIILAADNLYAQQLGVTILSILQSSAEDEFFNFYVLTDDFSEVNKQKVEKLKQTKNFEISYIHINKRDFENYPVWLHLKTINYYRLKIFELFDFDRALYLDCDLFVKKSLRNLYETNIDGYFCAAVEDINVMNKLTNEDRLDVLCLEKYFNAGVVLWNLKESRVFDLGNKCIDFIQKYPEKIKYMEQDALNYFCKGKVLYIDDIHNLQMSTSMHLCKKIWNKNKKSTIIIHFASPNKPWTHQLTTFKIQYYVYVLQTPWKYGVIFDCIRNNIQRAKKCIKISTRLVFGGFKI